MNPSDHTLLHPRAGDIRNESQTLVHPGTRRLECLVLFEDSMEHNSGLSELSALVGGEERDLVDDSLKKAFLVRQNRALGCWNATQVQACAAHKTYHKLLQ